MAAECYGGLNDWKEAERVYRAAAERYPERAFDWYFACRASGQMDRAAAERAVRNLLSRMPELPVGNAGFPAAQFYLITGDPRRAARILAQLFEADPTDLTGLYAAIAADAIDDGDQRSRVLSRFASLDEKLHPGKFVSGVILVCSSQRGLPTRERVAEMLSAYAPKLRGEAEFVAGMCLKNRGAQTDRLLEHWRNAADSKDARPAVRMHARILIQDTLKKPGRD